MDLWSNIKQTNVNMIDVPEEEEDKGVENVFDESLTEKFTNLKNEDNQVQKAQSIPNKMNPNRPMPRHLK